ncbi:hypothetical protein AAVH_42754 [Aphelenchoides avenae]|nr:hypothetical protein AAVH_42754 [Aphelenchus avenae]
MSDYHTESNRTVVQVYEKEIRDEHFEKNVEEAERHAHQLRREAKELFDYARMLKHRAEEAQREASDMAAQANRIAQEALNKHVEGQEKLALAAQKLLEAGGLLQKEASSVNVAEVPYNRHELMDIRQATEAVGQEIRDIKQEVKVVRETEVLGEITGGERLFGRSGERHFREEGEHQRRGEQKEYRESRESHFRGEGGDTIGEERFRDGEGTLEEHPLEKTEELGGSTNDADEAYRQFEKIKIR